MQLFRFLSLAPACLRDHASSLKHRITGAFLLLTLMTGTVFCLSAYFTYDLALQYVIRWHLDPIMRLLITAEESGELHKSGERINVSSAALARTLRVRWYTGDAIPDDLLPDRARVRELVRIKSDRYALTYRTSDGKAYAVVGKIKDLDDLEEIMADLAFGCIVASLLASALLAFWLSRRITSPLRSLARTVKNGMPIEETPLCNRKDEVGQLARAFDERERELRHFLNREQLFTGDVSHELRTPLTIMQGGVEILESRLANDPGARQLLPVLERMQRTMEGMTATVETMLLLARKPEQLERRIFDMSAVARREGEEMRTALAGRPVDFIAEIPNRLDIHGNPELASMTLHNLLDNARRYTEAGSITLRLTQTGICVEDTAPPIDPDVRSRMFQRGIRGTNSTPGSGLGLSLVQRGCEHLGWQVRHELHEKGNRFRIIF